MGSRVMRTAQGKIIDFDALMTQNEEVIAVGNQKVNARGDELGPGGKIIKTRNEVMEEHYKTGNGPIQPMTAAQVQKEVASNAISTAPPDVEDPLTEEEVAQIKTPKAKK